jgi:hypothetical protein
MIMFALNYFDFNLFCVQVVDTVVIITMEHLVYKHLQVVTLYLNIITMSSNMNETL